MKNFILFDFDGVIADTFTPAFEVQKMMCPKATADDYRARFEGNINDTYKQGNYHTDECFHDIDFFAEYIPRFKKQGKVFVGMTEAIKQLSKNYSLIIVSSTITSPIQDFLVKNNLASYFFEVMGNDVHTSKVEKIKMIFSKYNTTTKNCVFVTDTLGDMLEAEKTGVAAIGVTWGFHGEERLARGKPFMIVNTPEELLKSISNFYNDSGLVHETKPVSMKS